MRGRPEQNEPPAPPPMPQETPREDTNNVAVPQGMSMVPTVNYPSRQAGRAVTKVIHRCEYAKENQLLDLSECQLMHVPDAVYHLMRHTVILTVNLRSNVIRKITSKFMLKFGNLTELNLSQNQLTALPDEIRDLGDLEKIDISSNNFTRIPRTLFKLPNLAILNAANNHIREMDVDKMAASQSLKVLDLTRNPLADSCRKQLDAVAGDIEIHTSPAATDDDDDFSDGRE